MGTVVSLLICIMDKIPMSLCVSLCDLLYGFSVVCHIIIMCISIYHALSLCLEFPNLLMIISLVDNCCTHCDGLVALLQHLILLLFVGFLRISDHLSLV